MSHQYDRDETTPKTVGERIGFPGARTGKEAVEDERKKEESNAMKRRLLASQSS